MSPASTSSRSTRSTTARSIAAPLSTARAGPLRLIRARLAAPGGSTAPVAELSHWAPSHCRGCWERLAAFNGAASPAASTRRALTLTLSTLTLSQTLSRTLSRTLTRHKVWLKPSAEQSFLYGNHVLKVV